MATQFAFPASPTLNQIVTLPDGNQAQWNGTVWVSVTDNPVYPLVIGSGGTGATTAANARINLGLNTATGEFIVQKDGTAALPGMAFASEPGLGFYRSGAGSIGVGQGGLQRFLFSVTAPATTFIISAQANTAPALQIDRQTAVGYANSLIGSLAGSLRWNLQLGNGVVQMDFGITRYNDSGAFVDTPFSIIRANGEVQTGSPAGFRIYAPSGTTANLNMQVAGGVKTLRVNGANNQFEIINTAGTAVIMSLSDTGVGSLPKGLFWAAGPTGDFGITSTGSAVTGPTSFVNVWNGASIGAPANCQVLYDATNGIRVQTTVNGGLFNMKDGGVGQSQGGWTVGSDLAFKSNLTPIQDAMAIVRGWTGYTFDKIGLGRKAGLIANDVERDLPESISYYEDRRYMDHDGPIAVLTNALKEIDARLAQLESA